MTGFHADRSVLRSFDRPFSAAVAFFKGFILPRTRGSLVRSLGGWVGRWLGFVPPPPTTTAAVQLSALNKPAKSSGRGRRGGCRKRTEGNKETRRERKPASLSLSLSLFCAFGCLAVWLAGLGAMAGITISPPLPPPRRRSKMFTRSPLNHLKRQTKSGLALTDRVSRGMRDGRGLRGAWRK